MKKLKLVAILLILNNSLFNPAYSTEMKDSAQINKNLLFKVMAIEGAYYAASMTVMHEIWFDDHERVPFHFCNDNSGYLQIDKFGHAFGAYFESYIGFKTLQKCGVPYKKALWIGGTAGLILQTPIEIMDGIYEGWGFSWGDMAANALGSGLVIGQELIFQEQLIKYKFSYSGSEYAKNANGYLGTNTVNRLLNDYNGHTYWLSMPANRFFLKDKLPDWLNIAAGYSANGMYGEFENITSYKGVAIPETERYRQYLISLDVDWTKIKTRSQFLNLVFKGLTFVKLPFPAFEINSTGKAKGYWVYF